MRRELSPLHARMPGMWSIACACLLPAVFALSASGSDVLATYRDGSVTRAEYDGWLLANRLTDEAAHRRAQLEAIALLESLETAAVAAGLDRRPQTAFRLAQIEAGLLHGALREAVDRAIVIADAEVEAELKAEEKERFRPRSVLLRNIYKRVPAEATESTRAGIKSRMEELRTQLLGGRTSTTWPRASPSRRRGSGAAPWATFPRACSTPTWSGWRSASRRAS